jgi:hypothetical protein
MITKIYIEKGAKIRKVGGRGLILTKIVFHHNKNFRGARLKMERNDKNRAKSGTATVLP